MKFRIISVVAVALAAIALAACGEGTSSTGSGGSTSIQQCAYSTDVGGTGYVYVTVDGKPCGADVLVADNYELTPDPSFSRASSGATVVCTKRSFSVWEYQVANLATPAEVAAAAACDGYIIETRQEYNQQQAAVNGPPSPAAPSPTPTPATYQQGYSFGQAAAYPAVNNAGGEGPYCASNDPNGVNDTSGTTPSQDQGTTGTRWYEGCIAAIAKPSSPASKGYYQSGYQYGQEVAISDEAEIESNGGAQAFCSNESGGSPAPWIAGCAAAINAS